MKLRRFNESLEAWSEEKVLDHLKRKEDIDRENGELCRLVEKFLSFNKNLLPERLQKDLENYKVDYYVTDLAYYTNTLIATVIWDFPAEAEDTENIIEFFEFLENPDMYKDIKKYNL